MHCSRSDVFYSAIFWRLTYLFPVHTCPCAGDGVAAPDDDPSRIRLDPGEEHTGAKALESAGLAGSGWLARIWKGSVLRVRYIGQANESLSSGGEGAVDVTITTGEERNCPGWR